MLLLRAIMRILKRRWPQLSTFSLYASLFGISFFVDLVLEMLWMRLQVYSLMGGKVDVSVFADTIYRFPVYETICNALWVTCCTAIFVQKDDRGRNVAERGIDVWKARGARHTAGRFLATMGLVQAVFFVTFALPFSILGKYGDTWPADFYNKSYLLSDLCGPGTDVLCPGEPPRPGATHRLGEDPPEESR